MHLFQFWLARWDEQMQTAVGGQCAHNSAIGLIIKPAWGPNKAETEWDAMGFGNVRARGHYCDRLGHKVAQVDLVIFVWESLLG